jgi:hypothetical protein
MCKRLTTTIFYEYSYVVWVTGQLWLFLQNKTNHTFGLKHLRVKVIQSHKRKIPCVQQDILSGDPSDHCVNVSQCNAKLHYINYMFTGLSWNKYKLHVFYVITDLTTITLCAVYVGSNMANLTHCFTGASWELQKLWWISISIACLGPVVAWWLRCCTTSQTVPGSIPGGVTGFFSNISPSDHTTALGSTHPLVKMSTRNIPGGKGSQCVRLTSPHSHAKCHEIWEPEPPGTLWATPGLLWDLFTFFLA